MECVDVVCDGEVHRETDRQTDSMMELKIQLVPTGEIILPPGKNGESYCNCCAKVDNVLFLQFFKNMLMKDFN